MRDLTEQSYLGGQKNIATELKLGIVRALKGQCEFLFCYSE
jgi:hypothetical protein